MFQMIHHYSKYYWWLCHSTLLECKLNSNSVYTTRPRKYTRVYCFVVCCIFAILHMLFYPHHSGFLHCTGSIIRLSIPDWDLRLLWCQYTKICSLLVLKRKCSTEIVNVTHCIDTTHRLLFIYHMNYTCYLPRVSIQILIRCRGWVLNTHIALKFGWRPWEGLQNSKHRSPVFETLLDLIIRRLMERFQVSFCYQSLWKIW